MTKSRFSSLVYKIIGKPEVNHDEYSKMLNNALEELDLFTDPSHFAEIEVGHQILNRIESSDNAIKALDALLDIGRFKIIILNNNLYPIYNNPNARNLLKRITKAGSDNQLNDHLTNSIKNSLNKNKDESNLTAREIEDLNYLDRDEDKIYLKTVINKNSGDGKESNFHFLLVPDHSKRDPINQHLIDRFHFTQKEQQVLIGLIHGSSVKQIALNEFISENTVKTHLKSLYRKTGTKSQSQIVSLVLSHESQVLDSYFSNQNGFANLQTEAVEDQSITLKDGHTIYYCEYGPSDGNVLIVFHNGYGSRLTIPHNYQEICKKTNRRIIIIDRPGYGKTQYIKGHPDKWHLMLNEFIDLLGIDSYDVLGSVLGCALAIKFASQSDNKLKRLILSSPILINDDDDGKYLLGILAPSKKIFKGSTHFGKQAYELWLKSITLNLNTHYRDMISKGIGPAEKEIFERENTIDLIVEAFREAASQTLKGISNEAAYIMTPMNLDLSTINVPVDLWWGSHDERFSREGVERLAASFSDSNLYIKEGYTEHIYYALFEEIINTNKR